MEAGNNNPKTEHAATSQITMRQRNRVRVWWPPTDDNKRSGYRSARLTSAYLVFIARLHTGAATVDTELAEHVCTLGMKLSAELCACSGMYWPAQVLQETRELLLVKYDNGDQEWVQKEDIQPTAAPVNHGREKKPLQRGEFVEVHNNSKTDPAEWVGLVKAVGRESYKVDFQYISICIVKTSCLAASRRVRNDTNVTDV